MPEAPARIQMLDLHAQRRAIGPVMDERVQRVLDHGKFIMGPEVQELEEALTERSGVKHVVSCGNGTDALQLVLMAWGVGPGDAVFVPSFTFTATAEVVALLGATPVFCDVREDTYNLDVASLEAAVGRVLAEGSLTPRAVIPVDLFGLPADYSAIKTVGDRYELRILADAAQSFGATLSGRPVGSLAEATATSFFPAKPLGCYGDGGAVFTDDDELAQLLRSLRVHGKGKDKYDNVRIGMNSRLDTIQAAVLLAKLTVFDDEIDARQQVAAQYIKHCADVSEIALPSLRPSAWSQFTVRVTRGAERRSAIMEYLAKLQIASAIYYPKPLHLIEPLSRGAQIENRCHQSTRLSETVLSLPMHPYLEHSETEVVAARLLEAVVV